jgi:hypothetical protein
VSIGDIGMKTPKIDRAALAKHGGWFDPKTGTVRVNTPEEAKTDDRLFDRPEREEAS